MKIYVKSSTFSPFTDIRSSKREISKFIQNVADLVESELGVMYEVHGEIDLTGTYWELSIRLYDTNQLLDECCGVVYVVYMPDDDNPTYSFVAYDNFSYTTSFATTRTLSEMVEPCANELIGMVDYV